MSRNTITLGIGALVLSVAATGCQEGTTESIAAPIQIDSVDVNLTANDTRAGAGLTVDFAPAGGGLAGPEPLAVSTTVATTDQTVVPVDVTDDAVPANRHTGRVEIR